MLLEIPFLTVMMWYLSPTPTPPLFEQPIFSISHGWLYLLRPLLSTAFCGFWGEGLCQEHLEKPVLWFDWLTSSSRKGDIYTYRYTRPSLVELMICHLFRANATIEPMMAYCWWDLWKQISKQFEPKYKFCTRKEFQKVVCKIAEIFVLVSIC